MDTTLKGLRAELKLNATQMKNTGTDVESLKQKQNLLKEELAASREKTVLLNSKLQEAVKIYGENSTEAKNLATAVTNAKNVEAAIQNEIQQTNAEIEKQVKANSELTQAVMQADAKIEQLDQELKLNSAQLQGAGDKTELLKNRQKLLAEQSNVSAEKVKALEKALGTCGQEVGENSKEYAELRSKLTEARTEQAEIQNEIQQTTKELNEQKTALQKTGESLKSFGSGMKKAGQATKTLSAGAAAGIAGAGAAAVSFESAFAGVKKTVDEVYDANGKCTYSYQQLEDGIRSMAKEIPASVTEISAVAEAAGQLGIKSEDILGFTRVMLDLGESTNLASDVAAESIAKFANVTGLAADQTMTAEEKYGRLGSVLVKLGNSYATTEADIMAMAQNLASAGTQVGMSESDILALAASLSSVGLEAQAGGTAFSKAMIKMQLAVETNSDSLEDWASVAGMSAQEFAVAFKEDATGAMQAFIQGLAECGGESESAIKVLDDMGITETRMRDALLRSANASDIFTSAINNGKEAWEENSALTEEAQKRYETTASQIGILKSNFVDAGITLGSVFLPIINDGTKKLGSFADKISSLGTGSLKAIAGVLTFVMILSPLLSGIGKVSTGISAMISLGAKLSTGFTGIGVAAEESGAMAAAGMALPLGPILAITAGIIALVAIFITLWNTSESFRNYFTGMWEGFKDVIDGFLEKINFGDKIDGIREKFGQLGDKMTGLSDLFKVIGTIAAVVLVPALAVLSGIFNAVVSSIEPLFTILGGIIDVLSGLGTCIVGVFTGDLDLAKQGASTFIKGIGEIFNGGISFISGLMSGFKSGMVGFFSSLIEITGINNFTDTVKEKFDSIKRTISDKVSAARDAVKDAIDKIKSCFNFSWSLPELKLPHISITGSFSLNPPSVPHFGIEWRALGAIFKAPTILPSTRGLQGVAEAGEEAVLPIDNLRTYIREEMERFVDRIKIPDTPIDYDKLAKAMTKQPIIIECNDREIGRTFRGAF